MAASLSRHAVYILNGTLIVRHVHVQCLAGAKLTSFFAASAGWSTFSAAMPAAGLAVRPSSGQSQTLHKNLAD